MKKIINHIFLLFIMVTSCTFGNAITPSPTEFNTQMPKPSSAPTINHFTVTATPFTLATAQEPQESCNLSGDVLPGNAESKIIFQEPDVNPDIGLYFYDMQDGQKHIIPNTEEAFGPFVFSSPDHEKAAFFDIKNETVGIISLDGITTESKINGIF